MVRRCCVLQVSWRTPSRRDTERRVFSSAAELLLSREGHFKVQGSALQAKRFGSADGGAAAASRLLQSASICVDAVAAAARAVLVRWPRVAWLPSSTRVLHGTCPLAAFADAFHLNACNHTHTPACTCLLPSSLRRAATAVSMCTMAAGAPLRAAATPAAQAATLSHVEIRQPVAVSKDLTFTQREQQQLEREQQLLQQQLEQGEQRHQQKQHSEQQQQEQQLGQQQQEASAGAVMNEFLSKLPKAELHIHLEGTLEIPMMFDLAGV